MRLRQGVIYKAWSYRVESVHEPVMVSVWQLKDSEQVERYLKEGEMFLLRESSYTNRSQCISFSLLFSLGDFCIYGPVALLSGIL